MLRNKGGAQVGYYKISWKCYLEILLTLKQIKLVTTLLTWKHNFELDNSTFNLETLLLTTFLIAMFPSE